MAEKKVIPKTNAKLTEDWRRSVVQDNTKTTPKRITPAPAPVNTTSEFLFTGPKKVIDTSKGKLETKVVGGFESKRNPNAQMGLINVSPEFELLSMGGGLLSTKIGKNIVSKVDDAAEGVLNTAKSTYYNKASWTFKTDPNKYYRAGSKEMVEDASASGVIRVKAKQSLGDIARAEGRVPTLLEKLDAGSRAGGNPYFAKGKILSDKFAKKYGSRSSDYGDYVIETSSENMKRIGTKGKKWLPEQLGASIPKGSNATPVGQLLTSETRLLKPSKIFGLKEIKFKSN